MKKSDLLKQERAAKVAELEKITNGAEADNKRDLTTDEETRTDALFNDIAELDAKIERQEKIEALNKAEAAKRANELGNKEEKRDNGEKYTKDEREASEAFSMTRFVRNKAEGIAQTGAEAEMLQEGKRIAASSGLAVRGSALPNSALVNVNKEKRAAIAAGSNDSIPTESGPFIDALREETRLIQLGATVLPGLTGNVAMGRLGAGSATWEGETDSNAESGATIDGVTLTPKRLSAKTYVTHQFLAQSPYLVENILRQDLLSAIGEAVDNAGIAGASGGDNPTGILNMSSVNSVAIGTNGGAITHAKVLEMLQEQTEAKAFKGSGMGFITSPRTYYAMAAITKDSGSGRFLQEAGMMEGLSAYASNYVPINLTKGSGTALSAIILGWFPNLAIGQFGVNDVVVDPYTAADDGQIKLVINSFWDIKARQETAFTVCKDITS